MWSALEIHFGHPKHRKAPQLFVKLNCINKICKIITARGVSISLKHLIYNYWTFTAWLASFVCIWKHFPDYINSQVWRIAAWLSECKQESNYGLLQSRKPGLKLKNILSGWAYSGKQWAALDDDHRNDTIHYGLLLQPLYNAYRQWFVFAPFLLFFSF